MTPRAVLFDVMGTLVHEPHLTDMPRFFGVSAEELRALRHPTAWVDFERGDIDEAEYARRFFLDGRPLDLDGLKRALYESYAFLDGMEALLAELSARAVRMHALSNYAPWFQMIEEKLALSRFLEWSFVSCDTRVRKPDPRAYTLPAERLGLAPKECLFIDDRAVNVEAARAVGMDAVLFEGHAALRRELVRRGVL